MDKEFGAKLERQGYRFLGEHSALKTCDWTRRSIVNDGICYKEKFYGINCHRCAQISVTVNFCDMDCVYCWREHKNFPFSSIDEPCAILDRIPAARKNLLMGLGGHKNVDKEKLKESLDVKHVAISLTGETLYYPKLNELVREVLKRGMSCYVVTNGSQPEILSGLEDVTQLYLSLDSCDEEMFNRICRPLANDGWKRLMKSLEVLSKKKCSTCIRLTLIRGMNMERAKDYAKLISLGSPDFVEVKAFMLVGAARKRLKMENMPFHPEVREFAERICEHCDYFIVDEQEESRVVLLRKKSNH